MNKITSVISISPLYSLGAILGLMPPFSFNRLENPQNLKIHKYYAILLLFIAVVGYIGSTFRIITDVYPYLPSTTLIVTDAAFNLILTVTSISSILIPSIWNVKDCNMFLELFRKSKDICGKSDKEEIQSFCCIHTELAIGHIVLITLSCYDTYLWITILGFDQLRNYLFRTLQIYQDYVMVELIHHFLLMLNDRFQAVNNLLKKIQHPGGLERVSDTRQLQVIGRHNLELLREALQLYEILIDQVSLFNKLFGWQTLFLAATIILGLLNSLDVLTVWGIYQKRQIPLNDLVSGLIIVLSCRAIGLLILGTIVAASCDAAAKEAQLTAEICYRLLLNLPPNPEKQQDQTLREQLYLLAQLSSQRCPNFSAAGFFKVDYSMVLALFSSVTSYVVVVIQFNK